jgi:hypothetical protein
MGPNWASFEPSGPLGAPACAPKPSQLGVIRGLTNTLRQVGTATGVAPCSAPSTPPASAAPAASQRVLLSRLGLPPRPARAGIVTTDLAAVWARQTSHPDPVALNRYLFRVESRLDTEDASGSTLARETVADRDSNRLPLDGEPELLTTTRGVSRAHERDRRQGRLRGHSRTLAQPSG